MKILDVFEGRMNEIETASESESKSKSKSESESECVWMSEL